MEKPNRLVALLGFLLLLTIVFPGAAAAAPSPRATMAQAKKAALFHVVVDRGQKKDKSAWFGKPVQLKDGRELYDPSGSLVGYYFNLQANGQPTGFIIVGADMTDFPIIAFSYEAQLITSTGAARAQGVAASRGQIKSEKVVYLGGARLFAQFQLTDGSARKVRFDGEPVDDAVLGNSTAVANPDPAKSEQAKAFWNHMLNVTGTSQNTAGNTGTCDMQGTSSCSDGVTDLNPDGWETGWQSATYGFPGPIPDKSQWVFDVVNGVSQWIGCTPTAASNILAYWSSNGYSGLMPTTHDDIVRNLRTYMSTTQDAQGNGVTTTANAVSGLQRYARDHGDATGTTGLVTNASYTAIKNEIGGYWATLINVYGQTYYSPGSVGHSLTGVGYQYYTYNGSSAGHEYLIIYDNWANPAVQNVYLAYGRNYTQIDMIWFHP